MRERCIFLLMILSVAMMGLAEDNPCESEWQWQTFPVLSDIPGGTIDNICVGMDINFSPDWGEDSDGVCADNNECEDPVVSPLSVTYTWELYLGGQLMDSGEGQTINSTCTVPGYYYLLLEKTGVATRSQCVWTLQKHFGVNFKVVEPEITTPPNLPQTANNYTFNTTAHPNGECVIYVVGTSNVDAAENAKLEWSLDEIQSTTQTVDPADAKGDSVTFTYNPLPAANSYFGDKWLTLTHPAGCEDSKYITIFWPKSGYNHPGAQTGNWPNWHNYWRQTDAYYYYYGGGSEPIYSPSLGQPGLTTYNGSTWVAHIGPSASGSTTILEGDQKNQYVDGIDLYAFVWRHEARHVNVLNAWFPNGQPSSYDVDDDDIPDSIEPNLGQAEGGPYDPTKFDSDGDGMNDGHEYVYFTQANWNIGSADHQDWSNPGHQSNE